jgi:hypothetical protein
MTMRQEHKNCYKVIVIELQQHPAQMIKDGL